MTRRFRLTGKERREERRDGSRWQRDVLPFAAGALITGAIGAVVLVLVFAGDSGNGGGSGTAATATPAGPPSLEGEATYTDSGLGIIEIEPGSGPTPETGQTLSVHFTGWLSDGTRFASTLDDGQPVAFVLGKGKVISAWDEGLATMRAGGKRRLIVPAKLGYGAVGREGYVPPNTDIIFDVELQEIRATPPPTPTATP
jgi:peptidylprolyl isomerase